MYARCLLRKLGRDDDLSARISEMVNVPLCQEIWVDRIKIVSRRSADHGEFLTCNKCQSTITRGISRSVPPAASMMADLSY